MHNGARDEQRRHVPTIEFSAESGVCSIELLDGSDSKQASYGTFH
jgi:hypothetical protein